MLDSLRNKAVVITGSSIGIGREDAYLLALEGCKLVITYYKDKDEADKVKKKCLELGSPEVLVLQLNIGDDASIQEAVKKVVDKFGKIDVLINNAGIVARKNLQLQTYKEIEGQIRINLEGLIKMTKESLPYITETIVNIGSRAGQVGLAELTTYGAAKWGVRGFSKALAAEIPHLKIYVVNPVITATRMRNFEGMPPVKVAEVIVNLLKGKYNVQSGDDIDVPEYVK